MLECVCVRVRMQANKLFVPVCLTYLAAPDKVAVVMTVKKAPSNSLGNGYRVPLLSPISCRAPSHPARFPGDTGPPSLNFIADYPSERREEEPLSCK